MPYDTIPGSTDPTTLDGGVYSPIPGDPAILIETLVEANVAAATASAAAAAASAAAALASQGAANTSAIAAAASQSAAASSESAASASASTASTAATSAAGSAAAAATSATNTSASATAASNSASAAATSATNASNSASAASSSASAAAASAAAALASENNAAASFLSFDQKYLGAKAANPTVNNQGGALAAGMLYFNTGSNELRMYTGSAWIGVPGVLSFNTRTGAVTLTSGDVTSALTYTPANKAGDTFTGAVAAGSGIAAGNYVLRAISATGDRVRIASLAAGNGGLIDVTDAGETTTARSLTLGATHGVVNLGSSSQFTKDAAGNIGIGLAPVYRVDALGGNGNGYRYTGAASQVFFGEASSSGAVGTLTNHALSFLVNSSAIARFTTQGNFGVGITPSASWRAGAAAIQAGVFATLHTASNGAATLAFGAYESGPNAYSYYTTGDLPTAYQQLTGEHIWSAAAAGSAGNPISFTELARLNSTGFGIGVSPSYILDVKPAANAETAPTARFGNIRPLYMQPGTGSAAIYGPALGMGAYLDTVASQYIQPASIGMAGGAVIAAPHAGGLQFYAYNAGAETGTTQTLASTLRMVLDGSGNLGIGGTPLGKLWVQHAASGVLFTQDADGLALIGGYTQAGGAKGLRIAGSNGLYLSGNGANVNTVSISSTGFVGIGGPSVTSRTLSVGAESGVVGVRIAGGSGSNLGSFLEFVAQGAQAGYVGTLSGILGGAANNTIINYAAGAWAVYAGGNLSLNVTSGGTIQDAAGIELGWKGVPQSSTTSGNLAASDRGKHVPASAGVTVPASVFSIGDAVTVFNNTAGNITITQGASTTLRFAGTASTGNRTLAQRGLATILCVGSNEFVISGAGLS